MKVLTEKTGLLIDRWAVEEKTKDPCYVFAIDDYDFNETSRMRCLNSNRKQEGIVAYSGDVIFGPYLTLPSGHYCFMLDLDMTDDFGELSCKVTSKRGQNELLEKTISAGKNYIEFQLEAMT